MRHNLSSHKSKKAKNVLIMKRRESSKLISSTKIYSILSHPHLKDTTIELIWIEDENCLKLFGDCFMGRSWSCFLKHIEEWRAWHDSNVRPTD